MSYGQAPFVTNFPANTLSLINVGSEETENANELITFIKGTAGNGKRLFVDTNFSYNPSTKTLASDNFIGDTIEFIDNATLYPTNMKLQCFNGNLFIIPIDSPFPLTDGTVSYGRTGTIELTGTQSFFQYADRSTGDFFRVFCDNARYIIQSNFVQNIFEINTDGLASLIGTSAGLKFFERLSSPTNYYQFFTSASGSVFTLTYNATTIATITTAGVTTLVPQKIQNTLSVSAVPNFLTFMANSVTTTAGQTLNTHATLSYVPTTGTLSATTFSGSLTGSATLIDNTISVSAVPNFLTFLPNSATTTAGQVVGTHATLSYVPTTGTLSATTFSGSLTGSATLIDNTISVSAVSNFLTFLPNSATTPAGQVVGTHATLSYVPSTATLTTTNMTATTFTGSLTGSATLIDNTLQTTGTKFLTFLPNSATTPAGQVVGTHASLFYVVDESQLNIGNNTGITGTTPLAILNNALADTEYNNIQLGHSGATYKSWFIGAQNTTTAANTIFSIAPYGLPQDDHFYITAVAKASAKIIEGRDRLQTYDRTNGAIFTKHYTDDEIIYTDYNDVTQTSIYTSAMFGYPIPDGYTGFKIGNGANGTQIILDDIVTCKNAITNQTGFLRFWNDNFDSGGLGGSWGVMYEQNRFGINKFYTNNSQYIPFDMPILTIDSKTFLNTPCVPNTLTGFVTKVLRSGGTNIYDITIKVSGHNPYGRTLTISNQVGVNFIQTSVSGATFPTATARQTYSITSQSAKLNGSSFTGYTFSSTGTAVNYFFSASAISVWNIFQPVGQVTWVITPDNTGNEIDTYVLAIDFGFTENTLTGVTRSSSTNFDGSRVTLAGTSIVAVTSRTSGSGTLTITPVTPTNTLLTAVRSGDDMLRIDYDTTLVSASTIQTSSAVSGTYYPLLIDSTLVSGTSGATGYTDANGSISIDTATAQVTIGTAFIPTLTSTTFNRIVDSPFVAPLGSQTFLNCFDASYTNYEITIFISDAILNNTYLLIDFASSAGVRASANWRTATHYFNGATLVSVTTLTTGAYVSLIPNIAGNHFKFFLYSPATTRRKGIQATNSGYLTSGTETSYITTGGNISTTSYPSLFVSGGGGATALNGRIVITGVNGS